MKIKFKKRVKVNLGGIFNLKTQNIPQVEKKEETEKERKRRIRKEKRNEKKKERR